ncbi:hypothetical protein NTE_03383 [Candidatus Nitrososphaera evergladensis SR1]|uniref:Uncharacterized protein n=1 Tax=Candidatus Nitrososphaera evergladensis SR1 TaxID=1459636 RepID=A0A075MUS0_9ARCH|nr:hypothetical protein [Candidatus Nitrososphaera evergladensis]AIF85411.1 hypothetical protein NTE_03383 [Candidatus Nitrososphaera evergladensis SR1]
MTRLRVNVSPILLILGIVAIMLPSLSSVGVEPAMAESRASIIPSMPFLKSADQSVEVQKSVVGKQVVVWVVANNREPSDLKFAQIIEIRNSIGVTEYLAFQTGTLGANNKTEMGISWTPLYSDIYTLRTFAVSGLENPESLGPIAENSIEITA